MTTNFKRPLRNKFIAAIALLLVLPTVFIVLQRGRTSAPPNEYQGASTEQSANQKESGHGDQVGSATASESRLSAGRQLQFPQSNERTTAGSPEYSSAVIQVSGFRMQERLIHKVDPVYPEKMKSTGLSNNVMLNVTIDEKGTVTETRVGFGIPAFAEAAAEAVGQWRYEPIMIDGMPTPAGFNVEVNFASNETVNANSNLREQLAVNHVSFIGDDPSDTSVQAHSLLSMDPFRVHDGREYYSVTPEMSAPVVHIDKRRLQEAAYAGWSVDDRLKELFDQPVNVTVFINENGDVDGVQAASGQLNPAFKEELMNLRFQSPASFSGKAVPSWFILSVEVPDFLNR